MKIAVLGTGMVGTTIGSRLVELGHEVCMGSRTPDHAGALAWAKGCGTRASQGTFATAASFGEVIFNCTNGGAAPEAVAAAAAGNVEGKILIDVSNPLDGSMHPPGLLYCNDTSLAERLQAAHPGLRVVKALNTMSCDVMVRPRQLAGGHNVFVSGNDAAAKARVSGILRAFGWNETEIIDLGDITTARGSEMLLPLWLRLWGALGTPKFNIKIVR